LAEMRNFEGLSQDRRKPALQKHFG
jgi:hypothetical protein